MATKARKSASGASATAAAALLAKLFASPSAGAAASFLASKSCSKAQRKGLAQLAGLEAAWVGCDQAIAANVADMAQALVSELYEPFWFFRSSLVNSAAGHRPLDGRRAAGQEGTAAEGAAAGPRILFGQQRATCPLKHRKKDGYWIATSR